jgi:SapC
LINQNLHLKPTGLDSQAHRTLKLDLPISDWSLANKLNAMLLAATEFADASRDFPIVFVKAGKEPDGTDAIAPIAVFGLLQGENLFAEGALWRARYVPAIMRAYPFCVARVDDDRFAVCVDMDFKGASLQDNAPGQAVFEADGSAAPLLTEMTKQLEVLEGEIQRTRWVGKRLQDLGLLREMRFDVTLPNGREHTVDGFLTVDDKLATDLPADVVLELHRSGVLGLMHLHWASMGNMQRLVDWHVQRAGITATG